jgi:hypothetical protein
MDWDRLKTFYRVAQYKSFTDASVGDASQSTGFEPANYEP